MIYVKRCSHHQSTTPPQSLDKCHIFWNSLVAITERTTITGNNITGEIRGPKKLLVVVVVEL